jgi:hypothetical protein
MSLSCVSEASVCLYLVSQRHRYVSILCLYTCMHAYIHTYVCIHTNIHSLFAGETTLFHPIACALKRSHSCALQRSNSRETTLFHPIACARSLTLACPPAYPGRIRRGHARGHETFTAHAPTTKPRGSQFERRGGGNQFQTAVCRCRPPQPRACRGHGVQHRGGD